MTSYEPTWESLDAHPTPSWFTDAKLGIWVHWGVYSVPAWAPRGETPNSQPYAEWYPPYMYDEETQTYEHHRETYGPDADYADFAADWRAESWDPDEWAAFFDEVGARYVLLTGEHHDGYPLWDCSYADHDAASIGPERDLVAELATAVRDRGLKFAPSYHAMLNYYDPRHPDDAFGNPHYDEDGPDASYVDYMNAKLRELIDRFEPDLLWLDGDWMADAETFGSKEVVADYYERAEEWGKRVAVNDRLGQVREEHGDFYTPEYERYDEIQDHPWETCRGIGRSFGYNRNEEPDAYLDGPELVELLVDVVSKNGNLLINVGPRADGTIPERQAAPLAYLDEWLDDAGRAVFETTPWAVAEDAASSVPVRYTWRDGTLYATLFERPEDSLRLSVPEFVEVPSSASATLLGSDATVGLRRPSERLLLDVDSNDDARSLEPAVVALSPIDNPRMSR